IIPTPMEQDVRFPAPLPLTWRKDILWRTLCKRRRNIFPALSPPCWTWDVEADLWIMDLCCINLEMRKSFCYNNSLNRNCRLCREICMFNDRKYRVMEWRKQSSRKNHCYRCSAEAGPEKKR